MLDLHCHRHQCWPRPAATRTRRLGASPVLRRRPFHAATRTATPGTAGEPAAAIAAVTIGDAATLTTGELGAVLRRLVLARDPDAARKKRQRAGQDARVETWAEPGGTAALAGRDLPPADALAADANIGYYARQLKKAGAPATLELLRAKVFTALLTSQPLSTLLPGTGTGDNQDTGNGSNRANGNDRANGSNAGNGNRNGGSSKDDDGPGQGNGGGGGGTRPPRPGNGPPGGSGPPSRDPYNPPGLDSPPADRITRWLAGLKISWLQATACDHARETPAYQPSAALRHLIKTRDRTCTYPGCRRAARQCDDDHTLPHDQGGRTCECNLSALCRRHHAAKQARGWHLEQPPPGTPPLDHAQRQNQNSNPTPIRRLVGNRPPYGG